MTINMAQTYSKPYQNHDNNHFQNKERVELRMDFRKIEFVDNNKKNPDLKPQIEFLDNDEPNSISRNLKPKNGKK